MRAVTQSMTQVVKGMDLAMKSMDLEKISAVMEKFEGQFEDLDVVSGYYEGVAGGQETLGLGAEGQTEVDALMGRVADEAGIELQQEMNQEVPDTELGVKEGKQKERERDMMEEGLGERLRALRN